MTFLTAWVVCKTPQKKHMPSIAFPCSSRCCRGIESEEDDREGATSKEDDHEGATSEVSREKRKTCGYSLSQNLPCDTSAPIYAISPKTVRMLYKTRLFIHVSNLCGVYEFRYTPEAVRSLSAQALREGL